MERNEINEFIENLKEEKNLSETEANELKETLEISAIDIEPARLATFIKAVKDEISAPASTVFSERGVNVENIKVIAKNIAKTVKKQQEVEKIPRSRWGERSETEKEFDDLLKEEFKENLEDAIRNNNEEAILRNLDELLYNYEDIPIGTAIDIATRSADIEPTYASYYDIKPPQEDAKEAEAPPKDGIETDSSQIPGDSEAEQRLNAAALMERFQNKIISSETADERNKHIKAASYFFDDYMKLDGNMFFDNKTKTGYDPKTQKYTVPLNKPIKEHVIPYADIIIEGTFSEGRSAIPFEKNGSKEVAPGFSVQKLLESFDTSSISNFFDINKAENYIKAKQSADHEIAKLDQAIEARSQSDKFVDESKLPGLAIERAKQARLRKEACQNYALLPSEMRAKIKDPSMDRENTLLTDLDKRKMISDLYFDKGLSAVEIYEMMKKEEIISGDTYLIPDDVLDVVLAEGKKFGLDNKQLRQLQADERKIEDQWVMGRAYRTIANNARDKYLEEDSTKASKKKSECDGRISVLKLKNRDLREKVSQAKAEMGKESSSSKLVVENVVTDDYMSKIVGAFGKHNFNSVVQARTDNPITNGDVTEQARTAKMLELVRQQRDSNNKNPSPNRDDDDGIIE